MSFRNVPIKGVYRTATDSLIRDFYLPFLSRATHYDRAVGYFSASMLVEAALGLSGLIKNKGRMRLIIGHPLTDEEFIAVQEGAAPTALLAQRTHDLLVLLERTGSDQGVYALELLSWMVATHSIEIRFAFRSPGMYHEKIGILTDSDFNQIVFQGSANESANALLPTRNFESLTVYPNWRTELFAEYGEPFVQGFADLWENRTPNIQTVPVPSEFYSALQRFRSDKHFPPDLDRETALHAELRVLSGRASLPLLPATWSGHPYALKGHQQTALQKWHANSYNGIFALATGSGKTVTALHAATRIVAQNHPLVLVVSVPYLVLAEQWVQVMARFGMHPIRAFNTRDSWKLALDQALSTFRASASKFVAVIVVNDTLQTPAFQECLSLIPPDKLYFVGDECHHHSNPSWLQHIPNGAKFKLGMSATPWNPGRTDHQAVLQQIYGPIVAHYSLDDALRDEVLCPYDYYWVPCGFEDDEAEQYEQISFGILALIAEDPQRQNPGTQTRLQSLFSRRTRLLGALRDKTHQLRQLLLAAEQTPHTLFYCGEGAHPIDAGERLIDANCKLLSSLDRTVGRITAEESASERARILHSFDDGVIDAISAIRVLDEGFDIPSCRTAFLLASSNSYRQYVQRRGRVLRQSAGKPHAVIYDLVAVPSVNLLQNNHKVWRQQLCAELNRVRSFVNLARNANQQQLVINQKMQSLGLMGIYYEELPISEEDLYGD